MARLDIWILWRNSGNRCTILLAALIFILCITFFQELPATEQDKPVVFLYKSDVEAYRIFQKTINQLRNSDSKKSRPFLFLDTRALSSNDIKLHVQSASLVVTLGLYSTRELTGLDNSTPRIHSLISLENYQKIKEVNRAGSRNNCALVIDQPLERVVSTAKKYLPNLQRIGIITDPDSDVGNDQHIAGIEIIYEYLGNDIHSTIRNFAEKSVDIIVATQNSSIYNNETARNILISSYHFNIPLIGYSESFVKAGAILGVYSTPAAYAVDVYGLIKNPDNCSNSTIMYSSEYITKTNPQVANSLGIRFDY